MMLKLLIRPPVLTLRSSLSEHQAQPQHRDRKLHAPLLSSAKTPSGWIHNRDQTVPLPSQPRRSHLLPVGTCARIPTLLSSASDEGQPPVSWFKKKTTKKKRLAASLSGAERLLHSVFSSSGSVASSLSQQPLTDARVCVCKRVCAHAKGRVYVYVCASGAEMDAAGAQSM